MTDSLTGRVALVTGGSKGIGRAVALALAGAGADVAICARKMTELEPVAEEVRALGRRSFAAACDVTDSEQVSRLPAAIAEALGAPPRPCSSHGVFAGDRSRVEALQAAK